VVPARILHKHIALCILGVCFLSCPSNAKPLDRATLAGLKPHKALYDVKLFSRKSSARIANITGKVAYEWHPECDAWTTSQQFNMTYEYFEMPPVRIKSDFSTYESFDGTIFNYTSQKKQQGRVFEEIRGNAGQIGSNEDLTAIYTIPKDLVINLTDDTLFPIAHTLDVLDKIKAGKKFYNATVFDGSDEEGATYINSFIGGPAVYEIPEIHKNHIDNELINTKSWSIRLAFFPQNKLEEVADYEMSIIFHENGVISDMIIDYENFSVTQKLVALDPLTGSCDEGNVNIKEK